MSALPPVILFWAIWLILGAVIVVIAAAMLLTIIYLAHSIAKLAATALEVVGDIETQTRPIWQLSATNKVAGNLEAGAGAIANNAETIATVLNNGGTST